MQRPELIMFQAEDGDCFCLRFIGNDNNPHNILIDTGRKGLPYTRTLGSYIKKMQAKKIAECIDLLVITHIDNDHIGGVAELLKDCSNADTIKSVWFNNDSHKINLSQQGERGIAEGIELRNYLRDKKFAAPLILASKKPITLFGAEITILSPNPKSLQRLLDTWKAQAHASTSRGIDSAPTKDDENSEMRNGSKTNDYHKTVAELSALPFIEDATKPNGSSIAFILKVSNKSYLFLADAFPSVIADSLEALGYTPQKPLKIDYVKIAHHGSKYNTHLRLLGLIDSQHYIISSNGSAGRPHKQTLALILTHPYRDKTKKIFFYFNYKSKLDAIFTTAEKQAHNFECIYNTNTYFTL